jgi:hypothetical protein
MEDQFELFIEMSKKAGYVTMREFFEAAKIPNGAQKYPTRLLKHFGVDVLECFHGKRKRCFVKLDDVCKLPKLEPPAIPSVSVSGGDEKDKTDTPFDSPWFGATSNSRLVNDISICVNCLRNSPISDRLLFGISPNIVNKLGWKAGDRLQLFCDWPQVVLYKTLSGPANTLQQHKGERALRVRYHVPKNVAGHFENKRAIHHGVCKAAHLPAEKFPHLDVSSKFLMFHVTNKHADKPCLG